MLLQFTIENFLSFRDRTVLSMLADPRVTHTTEQTRSVDGHEALRMAALYGANGSGKSNLVKAFAVFHTMVLDGTTREDDRFPIVPFKLDTEHSEAPTHIEIDFILDNVHYSYGFDATTRQVHAEWLYRIEPGGETPLFTRDSAKGAAIVLGDTLSADPERRRILGYAATLTRENQLFLAEAGQQQIPELDPFRDYFRRWTIVGPESSYGPLLGRMANDSPFLEAMAEMLAAAGTGVAGLRVSKRVIEDPPAGLADFLERAAGKTPKIKASIRGSAEISLDDARRLEILELWAMHSPPQGPSTELNIREESDGTQRLLHLAPLLYDLKRERTLCVIDELDRSLHPLLTRLFLQRFIAQAQSGTGQLIFTTHDTNILDFKVLSRDSVGFVEKDVSGQSITYPLSELDPTQVDEVEKQGLENAYLDGRFGAIPFLGIRKRS